VSAYAEQLGTDSLRRADLTARLAPLPWIAFVGALSRRDATGVGTPGAQTIARAEARIRVGGAWLSGGRIERDGGAFAPPSIYELDGEVPVPYIEPAVGGTVGSLRGRLWRDLYADIHGTVWDSAGSFRPRYQGRAELRLHTNWLRRFPSREFGANIAVFDEYRSELTASFLPVGSTTPELRRAGPSNQVNFLLELRLQTAVISFQIRNALGRRVEYVPGSRRRARSASTASGGSSRTDRRPARRAGLLTKPLWRNSLRGFL
jgi:hypothetical protein